MNDGWSHSLISEVDCVCALQCARSDDLDLGLGKQLSADLHCESGITRLGLGWLWAAGSAWDRRDSDGLVEWRMQCRQVERRTLPVQEQPRKPCQEQTE